MICQNQKGVTRQFSKHRMLVFFTTKLKIFMTYETQKQYQLQYYTTLMYLKQCIFFLMIPATCCSLVHDKDFKLS